MKNSLRNAGYAVALLVASFGGNVEKADAHSAQVEQMRVKENIQRLEREETIREIARRAVLQAIQQVMSWDRLPSIQDVGPIELKRDTNREEPPAPPK